MAQLSPNGVFLGMNGQYIGVNQHHTANSKRSFHHLSARSYPIYSKNLVNLFFTLIFVVLNCQHNIFAESVLAFILGWKSGKFQKHKGSNTLVTSYCIVWGVLCPMLNTGVGYCLFVPRYSRTSSLE